MNIGIYCLDFNGQVYIGRSNNLDRRNRDHRTNLDKGISNYKMLEAYAKYGYPSFSVLEYCTIDQLASKECQWIKEFNSIEDGLNITSGGDGGGSGVTHNRAIHKEDTILEVFNYLILPEALTYTVISSLTGVSVSTITNIVDSSAHIWLQEKYPIEYSLLSSIELKAKRKANAQEESYSKIRGKLKDSFIYPDIISPDGVVFSSITNAKVFAEEHGLSTEGICRLFSGKIKSHRNWKLA
jgi:hypothetical protein